MKTIITAVMLYLLTAAANAQYNSNMRGVILGVFVYTDTDAIYLKLTNQPTVHPTCNSDYFVIDASVSYERRQMLLARLLSAYAMKETVNIGYDNAGDCADGYIRAHRAG